MKRRVIRRESGRGKAEGEEVRSLAKEMRTNML